MSQQVLSVYGSTQETLTYLELCICHVLKLRSVLPPSSFQDENYLEMIVSRLSESFDKEFLARVVRSMKNWVSARQVHRVDLDIYNTVSEKLREKWIFNLEYFPAEKQVSIQNSQSAITTVFREIETKAQICLLPLGDDLTYDIYFKVNKDVLQGLEPELEPCLEPSIEPATKPDFTEVDFGNIPTCSHCLSQSCFSLK